MKDHGSRVSVITFNKGKLEESLQESGIKVVVIDERQSLPRLVRAVRRCALAMNATILHSHGYKENMVAFAVSKLIPSVRLVATFHGWPEVYGRTGDLKYLLFNRLNLCIVSRFFDRLVCVSEDMRENILQRYKRASEKVAVIRNGIETHVKTQRRKAGQDFVIGSCGRFVRVKDYPFLVAVAASIRRKNTAILFRLAGDGPELNAVRALVKTRGLDDSFSCVGPVDDMADFYAGLDLYINTSIHEGIPMSILEAMLYGLPVVAPRVGGLGEVVTDGVDGYLVDERDPDRYGELCLKLRNDTELYDSMSQAAAMKVRTSFSTERMTEDYISLYRTMV